MRILQKVKWDRNQIACYLLGQFDRFLSISDSETGGKRRKQEMSWKEKISVEMWCMGQLVSRKQSLDIYLGRKKKSSVQVRCLGYRER